jgi:uncharacterized iron-regulated protein
MKNALKQMVSLSFLLIFAHSASAQDNPAYVIYTKNGKKTTFAKMEQALLEKQYVFFGELHDNPIAHWLQYLTLTALYEKHGQKLIAGSEMFEQDNQPVLTAFQQGKIDAKTFEDSCRLWTNYKTDYKPMLEYATTQHIPWIATNIPRRYASLVYKKGVKSLDSLSVQEKSWIAPQPFVVDTTLSQYAALTNGEMHMGKNFVYAQAIKDATMAHFIWKAMQPAPNSVFYHLNGSYHSDFHQGILHYLQLQGADPKQMITVSTVSQDQVNKLDKEYLNKADFIIVVPATMPSTH